MRKARIGDKRRVQQCIVKGLRKQEKKVTNRQGSCVREGEAQKPSEIGVSLGP